MIQSEIHKVYKHLVFARFKGFLESVAAKVITTSLHSRSVLGRVIVESLTKELQLKRTFGCE